MASRPGAASRSEPRPPSAATPETLSFSMLFRPTESRPRKVVGSLVGARVREMPGMEMPEEVARAMPRVRKSLPAFMPPLPPALMSSFRPPSLSSRPLSSLITFSRVRALMNFQGMFSFLMVAPLSFTYSRVRYRAPRSSTLRCSSCPWSRGTVLWLTGMEQKGYTCPDTVCSSSAVPLASTKRMVRLSAVLLSPHHSTVVDRRVLG